jgi:hypothetical protein
LIGDRLRGLVGTPHGTRVDPINLTTAQKPACQSSRLGVTLPRKRRVGRRAVTVFASNGEPMSDQKQFHRAAV